MYKKVNRNVVILFELHEKWSCIMYMQENKGRDFGVGF